MRIKNIIAPPALLILVAAGFILIFGQGGSSAAEEGCITAKCHAGMLKAKHVHPGAEPCDSCHESVMKPHPQKKKTTFKLMQAVPGLCYQCHQPLDTMKDVHPPVKDGMCTGCHNPHDSTQQKLLAQPLKDLCLSCHPDKLEHKFTHGPAATGDCTVCHDPHQSENAMLTVREGKELCFMCHIDLQEEVKKKVIHPALDMGCTACHNPHGGAVRRFFTAVVPTLCYQCHPHIETTLKKANSIHPPVISERSCPSCHAPHASDAPKLLPKEGKDLCLSCHKTLIEKNQTVLHGPIKQGTCTACHNPHGSPNSKLLIKPFPVDFYVSYSDNEYQLCFSCHNRDLVRFPTTSFATGFRDGDRNLHYLHINRKDRGKSCRICHSLHASKNPRLLNDSVPFGKWSLPLKFIKTETGGSCAPGCHQQFFYDRKNPGKKAEPASKQGKSK